MIPHSRPRFNASFREAAARVLDSGHVAMGDEVAALEREVASRLQLPHAVAVDSGTSALMLAVRALKGPREKFTVGIPAYACNAVMYAVRGAGAEPLYMDCADDLGLDRDRAMSLADRLDAVVIVHAFGLPEPMACEPWPCPVVEDIAQAAGGELNGRPVGSYGDITVASFYATKPWGGACGGMALSHDKGIYDDILSMRNADCADASLAYAGNHQLSDVHAAMVRTRLSMAAGERRRRMRIAGFFDVWLKDKITRPIVRQPGSNHYRYIIRRTGCASGMIRELRGRNIAACRPVQIPISSVPGADDCPGAERAWQDCVSLPLLSNFSHEELEQMEGALLTCLS